MVLNMADFGKSWQSLQTLWNASRTVLKLFVTALRDCVCRFKVNSQRSKFGRLGAKGQGYNPQVLNMADLGQSWKSLHTLWNASRTVLKLFVTALRDCVCRFKVNSQRSKFGRLGAKNLGYNPQVLNMADLGKSWKSLHTLWNASKPVQKWFVTDGATVCAGLGWIGRGRKLADFDQNSWAIAHGFEHGRIWEVLEIARNSLKWLQNRSKIICNCLRDSLCQFRMNS